MYLILIIRINWIFDQRKIFKINERGRRYTVNKIGTRTDPRGRPCVIGEEVENESFIRIETEFRYLTFIVNDHINKKKTMQVLHHEFQYQINLIKVCHDIKNQKHKTNLKIITVQNYHNK